MSENQTPYSAGPPALTDKEEKALAHVPEINFENGQLVPKTFADAWYLCRLIAKSGLVPDDKRTPEKILVAWQYGSALGLDIFASIQNVAVVNGFPSVWGDSMKGIVDGSGALEEFYELEWGLVKDKDFTAVCIAKKKGLGKQVDVAKIIEKDGGRLSSESENILKASGYFVNRFTYQDAIDAGYHTKKGSWQTNPKRMCKLRARGFTLRDGFSGLLKGMRTVEEMRDSKGEELVEQPDGSFAPAEQGVGDIKSKVKGGSLDVDKAKTAPEDEGPDDPDDNGGGKKPDPDSGDPERGSKGFISDPNLIKASKTAGIRDGGTIDAVIYRRFWDTFEHYFNLKANQAAEAYFGDALVSIVVEDKKDPEHVMREALDNFAAFIKSCVKRFGEVPAGDDTASGSADESGLDDMKKADEPTEEDLLWHQFGACFKNYCQKKNITGQERANLSVEVRRFVHSLEQKGRNRAEIYREAIGDFDAFMNMLDMEKNRTPEPTEYDAYKNKRNPMAVDSYIAKHAEAFKADPHAESTLRQWYKRRFPDKVFPFDRAKTPEQAKQSLGYGDRPESIEKEDPTIDPETLPLEQKGAAAMDEYQQKKDLIRQYESEEPELMAGAKKAADVVHPISVEGCDRILSEFKKLRDKRDGNLDAMSGTSRF